MAERTLTTTVEGVGTFTFRQRTLFTQLQIEGAAERMTGGPVLTRHLSDVAGAVAALQALTVTAPDGWDLAEIDPLDEGDVGKVLTVYGRFREAEKTFRRGAAS